MAHVTRTRTVNGSMSTKSIVSSQALHQKVHFHIHRDYDADDNFYGTITGYTAPGLFDIEGQTRAGEERKLEIPPIFESPFLG
jgi:hypothetical protein